MVTYCNKIEQRKKSEPLPFLNSYIIPNMKSIYTIPCSVALLEVYTLRHCDFITCISLHVTNKNMKKSQKMLLPDKRNSILCHPNSHMHVNMIISMSVVNIANKTRYHILYNFMGDFYTYIVT